MNDITVPMVMVIKPHVKMIIKSSASKNSCVKKTTSESKSLSVPVNLIYLT